MTEQTAMMKLIEWLKKEADFISDNDSIEDRFARLAYRNSIIKATELLEEEKKQLVDAANTCSNVLIANDIVISGNQEISVGENYYNQKYKP